jgi:hypothetical protein
MRLLCVVFAASLGAAAFAGLAVASPTRVEFIRKGDALCAQTKSQLLPIRDRAQAAKSLPPSRQWAAVADIYADQIVIQRQFALKFNAIGTPAGDAVAAGLVSKFAKGILLAVRVQRGFATHDAAALQTALPAYLRFTLDLNKHVVAYGFHTCGK